jgi:prefoldin subunit 5
LSIDELQDQVDKLLDEMDELQEICDTLPQCNEDDGCATCETNKKIEALEEKIEKLEEKIENLMGDEEED